MRIDRLGEGDETRLRTVRLRALLEAPAAFGSTHAETASRPSESWTRQLRDLPTFVARVDGRDSGMVRYQPAADGLSAMLISMWVAPEARGRGVGDALIDAVVEAAREGGCRRVVLEVHDDNEPAIRLYARRGFVRVEGAAGPGEHTRALSLG